MISVVPAPKPAPVPQFATQMSSRRPRLKYHEHRGHAIAAVLYKTYGSGILSEDVHVFRRNAAGEYVEIASWKRGTRVTRDEVHQKIRKN